MYFWSVFYFIIQMSTSLSLLSSFLGVPGKCLLNYLVLLHSSWNLRCIFFNSLCFRIGYFYTFSLYSVIFPLMSTPLRSPWTAFFTSITMLYILRISICFFPICPLSLLKLPMCACNDNDIHLFHKNFYHTNQS